MCPTRHLSPTQGCSQGSVCSPRLHEIAMFVIMNTIGIHRQYLSHNSKNEAEGPAIPACAWTDSLALLSAHATRASLSSPSTTASACLAPLNCASVISTCAQLTSTHGTWESVCQLANLCPILPPHRTGGAYKIPGTILLSPCI